MENTGRNGLLGGHNGKSKKLRRARAWVCRGDAMSATGKEFLTLRGIVSTTHARAFDDQRRRLTCVLAEYFDTEGNIYRKAFESYGEPVIPTSGGNSEITARRRQW